MSGGFPHRLITIPISHYCEKARWALQRAGIDYREERHVQAVHQLAARRAGGGWTVPVLVTPEGVLKDSLDILAYADRHTAPDQRLLTDAEAELWERDFDASLGPHARLWIYSQVLHDRDIGRAYNLTGVPAWERGAFPIFFPVVAAYNRRFLKITPERAAEAKAAVDRTFDRVGEELADGRRYLCGERFSAADLTFACLAAAVLVPPEYGVPLPQPDELPTATAEAVRAWRAHPAGEFALRLFREERRVPAGSAG
jgi:glutathione S-transferase